MMHHESFACAALAAAAVLSAPSTAQAVFLPIPNASGVPIPGPFQAGHLSGFVPAPGALFGTDRSSVRVSADGSTVVLRVAKSTPSGLAADIAIWTENGGVEVLAPDDGIFGWGVSGISSDGAVVTGWAQSGVSGPAATPTGDYFRWQVGQGAPQLLPRDPQHPAGYFPFSCLSGDGNLVGGHTWAPSAQYYESFAGAIVAPTGATLITGESEGNPTLVNDLSNDGSVAVGQAALAGFGVVAYRWTAGGGLQNLQVPGWGASAEGCSLFGDVVVGGAGGFSGPRAFYWTAANGALDLKDDLIANFGLGSELQGWELWVATDVSFDGRAIVGFGRNPQGDYQAFLVRFPATPAVVVSYGSACTGPQGPLDLAATKAPYAGTTAIATCQGLSSQALQFTVFGFTPIATPLSSLLPAGVAGCDLLASPDVLVPLAVGNGVGRQSLAIPALATLVGQTYVQQVVRLDLTAGSGVFASVAGSNGLALTIGAY
ncbi:MAG: hypothetical protein ACK6DH_06860 [Planctomycetota bacterium]|jgi:uncharacterized membrane protein